MIDNALIHLYNSILGQEELRMQRVEEREMAERSQTAFPGRVVSYDKESDTWAISLGGPSLVRARAITNGRICTGDFVLFTRNYGEAVGTIDAHPSG